MSGPEKPKEQQNVAPQAPTTAPLPVDWENEVFSPDRAKVDVLLDAHEETLQVVGEQAAAAGITTPKVPAQGEAMMSEKSVFEQVGNWLSKVGDWFSESFPWLAPLLREIRDVFRGEPETEVGQEATAASVVEAFDPQWKEKVLQPEAPVFSFLAGKNPKITSHFGNRDDPMDPGENQDHKGIDITLGPKDTDLGEPIVLTHPVKVLKAEVTGPSGNTVTVQDLQDPSITYVFRHLQELVVSDGALLKEGALVGKVGNTGTRVKGAHLHFEVHKNGEAIDPQSYLGFS